VREFGERVGRSDLFFLAGAVTFNVMVAVVPLVILAAGISGFLVGDRLGRVSPDVVEVVLGYLPAGSAAGLRDTVDRFLAGLVADRAGLSVIGAVVLAWISTRLVGTLRVVLREIFDVEEERGIVRGKLFDFKVVLLGAALILLNFGVSVGIRALEALGALFFAADGAGTRLIGEVVGRGLSFASAWILFLLLYRFVPARRPDFRTAVAGATFAAVGFELLKEAFAWYVTSVADYSNAYGGLAAGAVLFFWIYYSSIVFVLGAIVARTYEVRTMQSHPSSRSPKIPDTPETPDPPGSPDEADTRKPPASPAPSAGSSPPPSAPAVLVLALAGALSAALLAAPASVAAQQSPSLFGGNGVEAGLLDPGAGVVMGTRAMEREIRLDRPLVDHDGPYIVVHLAENRVLLMEGTEITWSAPAGTGNGFDLAAEGREWNFSTPVGLFRVLRKEKDPVWIAPDWWFVQRGLRIPETHHPSRFMTGTLGTSALFLGDGIAIHGTDRPDLLLNPDPEARRVSHGCIRLTNEAARQLYHRIEVGTPVLIF
jgi:membrane protein